MTVGVDLIWQKLDAALNSPAPERVLLFADEREAVDALLEDVLIARPYLEGRFSVRHLMYGDVGVLPESLSAQALCVATEGVLWIDHYRGVGESAERARLDTLRVLEAICLADALPAFKLVVVLPGIWKGLVPAIVPGFYRQCGVVLELPAPVLSAAQKRDRDRQSAADMAASHGSSGFKS